MSPEPDLTVVIPVRDAADSIESLAKTVCGLADVRVQVVLVDDGSRDASREVLLQLARDHQEVELLLHDVSLGAGVARNEGFARARGRYTIFFDADDELHADALSRAVGLLDVSGADVAVMPYILRDEGSAHHDPMHRPDIEIWQTSLGEYTHRVSRLRDIPEMLGFTNYPWNKVLRTATYRATGFRFGETPVHNDILGHWFSLLMADRVLLWNAVICTHVVGTTGRNLTNRMSRARLHLFDALDEAYELLESMPQAREAYAKYYWRFAIRTSNWAADRISAEYRAEFNRRRRDHLLRMSLTDFTGLRMGGDPLLADTIVIKALG